jgi:nonsense-mediated mRNA decay protein 3
MEVDTPYISFQSLPQQDTITPTILCCNCGTPIDGTTAAGALCQECIRLTVDVSSGIQREGVLHQCGDCDRYLSPPESWIVAQPESRELLAICLRKLRGLSKVRIIDASFIWTEPHSRRVKVKITIQQEAFAGTIVQQTFEVEFMVANQQCRDCKKSYTHHTWRASVQVRQKVPHKRTFLYLEQLILKHNAHGETINIKERHDGIDFFFAARNSAEKFVDFLSSVVPVFVKKSQELISMDTHTSKRQYKFTFSVEVVPLCKDDLLALPVRLAKSVGNISPLCLVSRIGTAVQIIDPSTLQTADIAPKEFWHAPFTNLADVRELQHFIVLEIESLGTQNGHFKLAEATISPANDMGTTYYVRTHLGHLLHEGDEVLGYHITGSNYNNPQFEALESSRQYGSTIPDVILVKKFYTRSKKKAGGANRNWRLRRLAADQTESGTGIGGASKGRMDVEKLERDYEMFLRDVEEDEGLRQAMNLYRNEKKKKAEDMDIESTVDGSEDGRLKIPMEQLLEDMEEMGLNDDGDGVD